MGGQELFQGTGRHLLCNVPEGHDALAVAGTLAAGEGSRVHLHVARDDARMRIFEHSLTFFSPDQPILKFPAWDCLPYDRVSPNREVVSRRIDTLTALATVGERSGSRPVVITTVNALLQRVPTREAIQAATLCLSSGSEIDPDEVVRFFLHNGFEHVSAVREPGQYAFRGGILDVFPPGDPLPARLDLFGNELETIRVFDPVTQLSTGNAIEGLALKPASELRLDDESVARFRVGYREQFGSVTDDPLYVAVSEGRRQIGMEHWLPLFHEEMSTLLDYLPEASITLDHEFETLLDARIDMIGEFFDARMSYLAAHRHPEETAPPPYRPLPAHHLYLDSRELEGALDSHRVVQFTPFSAPSGLASSLYQTSTSLGGQGMMNFASLRSEALHAASEEKADSVDPFEPLRARIGSDIERGRQVVISAYSEGSRTRLEQLLRGQGLRGLARVDNWIEGQDLPSSSIRLAILPLEHGFTTNELSLITEQDILGERIVRPQRKKQRAEDFIADISEISDGDLVVHVDHGIGRYEGLVTLDVAGAPHDCLRILYAGDNRLYVPVEDVDMLSRYGSGETPASLDRLGSAAWQMRKARMKDRLRDIARQLIDVAAERTLREAPVINALPDRLQQFSDGFPYTETDDQEEAIRETLEDIQVGRPMDRLICGDVGFGKTEVALRAAFSAVTSGLQVAVVAPTTLLCRQHYETFRDRFSGTPYRVAEMSRLVSASKNAETRKTVAEGKTDIVVGTHALLGKSVTFSNLGLLVIDEEQRFGVAHKEKIKQLRAEVHVLTLTATPIPRTFQMALAGVKDMSLIRTPPEDRLAVRTFVMPYDPVVIREALMREKFRGGQIFYVCPRISDLDEIAADLREMAPEIKFSVAHGQMRSRDLEQVSAEFFNGSTDLLLSTQIVESGLDIPTANTMIIHRADSFGLAQLYQLRGRIGRSKLRAYCYLTLPPRGKLTDGARKRLEVIQTLDTLGAGFALASHDLDIRGAGNLLGEEQSGHVREVGVELYQHMLEEAVAVAKGVRAGDQDRWEPAINLGVPVMIPEDYVADLGLRMGLYRRIAALQDSREIDSFAAEMIDRFGELPDEVENLLQLVSLKRRCHRLGIEKLDAGPKGATLTFRANEVPNAGKLVGYIATKRDEWRLRPDQCLVFRQSWLRPRDRLKGALELAAVLERLLVEGDVAS